MFFLFTITMMPRYVHCLSFVLPFNLEDCMSNFFLLAAVPCGSGLTCSSQTAAGTCAPTPAPADGTDGGACRACNLAASPAGKPKTPLNQPCLQHCMSTIIPVYLL